MTTSATIAQVRNQLNDLDTSLLPDDIITQQIGIADAFVTELERDGTSTTNHDYAVILKAAYMSYLIFVSKYIGRAQGRVPPAVEREAYRLEALAKEFINEVIADRNVKLPPLARKGKKEAEGWHDDWEDG